MIRPISSALFVLSASVLAAEENRQLDSHEHGVGQLDIAFDGDQIAMELHAPGADIVGFEYKAKSSEDRAKVDAAVADLARPLALFSLPEAAECSVVQARASLESEEAHEEHEADDHAAHKEDDHADHAEHDHKDDDHDDHAAHDDHDAHDETHEEDHADAADHTEFHAEYLLNCANPAQVTLITFPYFETFPNALELEVQVISDRGASAFEVERDVPTLDLRDMF